ncbi:SWIM zinc finger family protein [Halorubrum depositum]|uniref:SWIM zinc finger family protein n=1 Tax=Halorubrum depositum TaxID=2583992 RepID=UPI001F4F49CB|nr:SWIM zinc finger family protein [Halorubrum depositum]
MTHPRTPPASAATNPDAPRAAPPGERSPERGVSAAVDDDDSERAPSAAVDVDDRSARAAAEEMTVRPLRDRRYVVETDGGTYVVALDAGTCTCPDHAIRGSRCKHLRRVAMEVTAGSVPAPDERVGACAVCGTETFVPLDDPGAHLCSRHAFEPGDVVRDRETGERLVVVAVTTERADAYRTEEDRTVDEYATNAAYGAHEPVIEAVYVDAVRPGRGLSDCERYAFPASRLVRPRRE